jgi:hypothetical protein
LPVARQMLLLIQLDSTDNEMDEELALSVPIPSEPTMITIQARVTVDEQGWAMLRVPSEIAPGEHDVVVVIEQAPSVKKAPIMTGFPRHDVQVHLPADFTFRREELYDDSGRGS